MSPHILPMKDEKGMNMIFVKNQYQDYYYIPSSTTGGMLSASMNSFEASSKVVSMDGSKSSESCGKSAGKETKNCVSKWQQRKTKRQKGQRNHTR